MTMHLIIHIREDLPMPTARALVLVRDLASIGTVESVQPDIRKDESLGFGQPLYVDFSGQLTIPDLMARMATFEGVTLEVREGEVQTADPTPTIPAPQISPSEIVEDISSMLVLAGPGDLDGVASIQERFHKLLEWATQNQMNEVKSLVENGLAGLQAIIQSTADQPGKIWLDLNRSITRLQMIILEAKPAATSKVKKAAKPKASSSSVPESNVAAVPLSGDEQDQKILADFLSRQPEVLSELESLAIAIEQTHDHNHVDALLRLLHTLKGDADLVHLGDVAQICHWLEGCLKEEGTSIPVDQILSTRDWLEEFYDASTGKGAPPKSAVQLIASFPPKPPVAQIPAPPPGGVVAPEASSALSFLDSPEMLETFVSESLEHLDNADVHLLTVETDPENREALNAVFRAFHTVKGSAGILGLVQIGELAHEAENLLDRAREGSLILAGATVDAVFETIDCLKRVINRFKGRLSLANLPTEDSAIAPLIERIRLVGTQTSSEKTISSSSESPEPRKPLGETLLDDGVITQHELDKALQKQSESAQHKRIGELLREVNLTTKAKVEAALKQQEVESTRRPLGEILVEREGIPEGEIQSAIHKQVAPPVPARIGEVLVKSGQASAEDVAQALRAQENAASAGTTVQVRETVKVDADRLDQLLDTIGELVIAESMVSQSEELKHLASPALLRHLGQLDKITRELQEMGTSLRMIPIRATFQKMARLVRDLTRKSGKKVDLVMAGEDTELDKTVVDQIGDPLVHMIRNAVDHGIELDPQERLRHGKPETGRIELRAYHKGGSIYIEVQDDGRGLNRETILAKALERGLIREGETLSDREAFNLIFLPGFSTAKTISDVSGRGVGMDVVKKNVEALRGQVDIMSEPGMGTLFTIRLPLTLAIIDGMVVRVSTERYIIPTLSVVQSIRPRPEEVSTVFQRGEMLKVQGDLIPLYRLDKLFVIEGAGRDATQSTVVVVEDDGRYTGLMVDELLGQQQIVIKPLGDVLQGTPGLSGGAIMPDGHVGLILDIGALVRLATANGVHRNGNEDHPDLTGSGIMGRNDAYKQN